MTLKTIWDDQGQLAERLRHKLYMGRPKKSSNRPGGSLALTEVTVQMIRQCIARQELAALDMNYASNLIHCAWISPASIILAMIYLDKLRAKHSDFLRQNSSQDLFLISVAVASKFLFDKGEDEAVYNDNLAEIVNMEMADINRAELDFLDAIEWSCFVNFDAFNQQLLKFEALVTMKELEKRGHANQTYSEILTLFEFYKFNPKLDRLVNNLSDFAQSLAICLVSYCAAVAILTASLSLVFTLHYNIVISYHSHQSMQGDAILSGIVLTQDVCSSPNTSLELMASSVCNRENFEGNAKKDSDGERRALKKLILNLDAFPTQDELLDSLGTHTSSLLIVRPYRYVKQF